MGSARLWPIADLILKLKDTYSVTDFIETGTSQGSTAAWAAEQFPKVVTAEFSKKHYETAIKQYGHLSNIRFLYADSRDACREIVPSLTQPAIFWLDSHWCGGGSYGEKDQCPLLEELKIIHTSPHPHFLMIDDARLFLSPPYEPHPVEQWPPITSVFKALQQSSHHYFIVIFYDAIIAVPEFAKETLICFCRKINTQAENEKRIKKTSRKDSFVNKIFKKVSGITPLKKQKS